MNRNSSSIKLGSTKVNININTLSYLGFYYFTYLQWFQYKIVHRIIVTNLLHYFKIKLLLMNIVGFVFEEHLFWYCTVTNNFKLMLSVDVKKYGIFVVHLLS